MSLVESINAIPPEIAEEILADPRCKRGVKTREGAKLWRGESEESGSGMAVYGVGLYFTARKSDAAKYGKVREVSRDMLPWGCLRFDTTNDFQIWFQNAVKLMGYPSKREYYLDFHDFGDFVRALDPNIDGIQMFTGSDAMFVLYPR